MAERPFAYVCSPFRGDVEKNTARAREYCRQVYEAGYTPLAPHLYFTQFLNDDYPKERVAGMEMGVALLPLCRVLVFCGSDITEGMKAEMQHAQRLGVEICTLEHIPPIPTLENYRDDLTNLENMEIAVRCIEGTTNSRFVYAFGDVSIHPDRDSFFAVRIRWSFDRDDMFFRVKFDAAPQKKSIPLREADLVMLQLEAGRIRTLLDVLKTPEFTLTPEEFKEFCDLLRQMQEKDAPAKGTEKSSVMQKIRQGSQDKQQRPTTKKHKKGDPEI